MSCVCLFQSNRPATTTCNDSLENRKYYKLSKAEYAYFNRGSVRTDRLRNAWPEALRGVPRPTLRICASRLPKSTADAAQNRSAETARHTAQRHRPGRKSEKQKTVIPTAAKNAAVRNKNEERRAGNVVRSATPHTPDLRLTTAENHSRRSAKPERGSGASYRPTPPARPQGRKEKPNANSVDKEWIDEVVYVILAEEWERNFQL